MGVLFDTSSFFLTENRFFPVVAKIVGLFKVNADLKPDVL